MATEAKAANLFRAGKEPESISGSKFAKAVGPYRSQAPHATEPKATLCGAPPFKGIVGGFRGVRLSIFLQDQTVEMVHSGLYQKSNSSLYYRPQLGLRVQMAPAP